MMKKATCYLIFFGYDFGACLPAEILQVRQSSYP